MTIFVTYYAAAFVLLYLELRGKNRSERRLPRVPSVPPRIAIAAGTIAYALQLGLVWYAATHVAPAQPWRVALPIGVASHDIVHPDLVTIAWLVLGIVQTLVLFALYRSVPSFRLVAFGCAALVGLSLAAPAFESPDPYAYVGDALLGLRSYAPPAADFAGQYAVINHLFQAPMLPAPYGPLWIAIVSAATAPAHTLMGKLLLVRLLGLGSFVALIAAMRAAGVPGRLLALAAFNPALALNFVADAHNDLLGIVPLVAAAALVRYRGGLLACGLIVVASAIKLPFAILGLPIFAAVTPRRRALLAASTVVAAVALAYWGGGPAYLAGLTVHVPAPGAVYALNLAVTVTALALVGIATIGGRRFRTGVWFIAMMSSYVATWYLAYGLPYALARRRILTYLLVALPLATALVDAKFMRVWTYALVVPLGVALYALRRRAAGGRRIVVQR